MSKPRHHTLDIYGTHLHAAYDLKAWRSLRRRVDFLSKRPDAAGRTESANWVPDGEGIAQHHVVLWVDREGHAGEPAHVLANTCAHEAAHAAGRILDHIGQPTTGDEALAYLVGWITGWLLEGAA